MRDSPSAPTPKLSVVSKTKINLKKKAPPLPRVANLGKEKIRIVKPSNRIHSIISANLETNKPTEKK